MWTFVLALISASVAFAVGWLARGLHDGPVGHSDDSRTSGPRGEWGEPGPSGPDFDGGPAMSRAELRDWAAEQVRLGAISPTYPPIATIPVRGSDWWSADDVELREFGPAFHERAKAERAERAERAGVLMIPDELTFPDGIAPDFGNAELRHFDGCGTEHDLSRPECMMRPAEGPGWKSRRQAALEARAARIGGRSVWD